MLFKYKISIEVEVEFDAPLLGADTTRFRRGQADKIAKKEFSEMFKRRSGINSFVEKEINEDNLKGKIKGQIHMGSADKNK